MNDLCEREGCQHVATRTILCCCYQICQECFDDLIKFKNSWKQPITELEMQDLIEEFMHAEQDKLPARHKPVSDINHTFNKLTEDLLNQ